MRTSRNVLVALPVLAVAAAVALVVAPDHPDHPVTGSAAAAAVPQAAVQHFASRPDLLPPVVRMTVTDPATDGEGLFFLAPKEQVEQSGPLILDGQGRVVWSLPSAPRATDFRVQTYRGQPVLTWWQGTDQGIRGYGAGEYVVMDSGYRVLATVRAAVGAQRFHWSALDHVPLTESQVPLGTSGTEDFPWDWFHVNSVGEDDGSRLLVSARNTSTVYDVDRPSGRVHWRLGGRSSDFRLGPGVAFAWQHDVRRLPDGRISVFDNEASPTVRAQSRALLLTLDEGAHTAALAAAYTSPQHPLAANQGDVQLTGPDPST